MAIQHHPLSNNNLGEFHHATTLDKREEGSQFANFVTTFYYLNGRVELDNKWNYKTSIIPEMMAPSIN